MHLFFTPDIDGRIYELNEEESRHCIKVLRLQNNDVVWLIDGRGGFYKARIFEPNARRCVLQVEEYTAEYGKRNHYLHIAISPTKNIERFEWFLEKATEIGIDEITPLITERSERREVKTERLKRIITSAVKQSIKAYYPLLNEPVRFNDFVELRDGQSFIAHCMDGEKISLKQELKLAGSYTILIGPEGDFSAAEVTRALEQRYRPISLGTSRLRTETAGLEACFEVNFLNR